MTIPSESLLVGSCLERVYYDILAWEAEPSADSDFDQVAKAVTLDFDRLGVQLRWDLNPPIEQLALVGQVRAPGPLTRRVDVSQRWEGFLGARLAAVSWAEQETPDGFRPWAVTLAFSPAAELVVALGELCDGIPAYIPDSLVVTGSREAASTYRPPASPTPAWTRGDVPPL